MLTSLSPGRPLEVRASWVPRMQAPSSAAHPSLGAGVGVTLWPGPCMLGGPPRGRRAGVLASSSAAASSCLGWVRGYPSGRCVQPCQVKACVPGGAWRPWGPCWGQAYPASAFG